MQAQQASFKPVQTSENNYPQIFSSYQPIQTYYNNPASNIQPYYFSQSISNLPLQNNSVYSPSMTSPQTAIITQKQQNQQQFQQQQSQFLQLNGIPDKIKIISSLFQINHQKIKELLSENLCVCCLNKIFENQQNNQNTIFNNSKEDKMKSLSERTPQSQSSHFNLELHQNNYINSCEIDTNTKILLNDHLNNEKKIYSENFERDAFLFSSNQTNLENINLKQDARVKNQKIDLQSEDIYSQKRQKINLLEKSDGQQIVSQQNNESQINIQKIKENTPKIKLIDSAYDTKEQSSSNEQSIISKEAEKKIVSYSVIKKSIFKQEKCQESQKKSKIQKLNHQQQSTLNDTSKYISYQNNSDQSQIQSQINQQSSNQSISSMSFCSFKQQKDLATSEQLNDQNLNNQFTQSNKSFQNESNYTKNLLKGFKRVVNKNYGTNEDFITEFNNYFEQFSLNNEFIMKLFSDSPYSVYFVEFLSADPSWWMKEARIKDTESQMSFFEKCQRRQFTHIRTKRKKFTRPKLI